MSDLGVAATPPGSCPSDEAASSGVSTVPASIPNADGWIFTHGGPPAQRLRGHVAWLLGRYGDVYGPLPLEMVADEAWTGNMFGAAHDVIAFAPCNLGWRETFAYQPEALASGIEARRAETGTGSAHESPVPERQTPNA